MENVELIDLFRNIERSNHPVCNGCPMKYTCDKNQITRCLFGTAADALKVAEQRIAVVEEERDLERFAAKNYLDKIDELVAQMPKEGEWIVEEIDDSGFKWCKWRCSVCHEVVQKGWQHTKDGEKPKWKYCPNCGAKMKESKRMTNIK